MAPKFLPNLFGRKKEPTPAPEHVEPIPMSQPEAMPAPDPQPVQELPVPAVEDAASSDNIRAVLDEAGQLLIASDKDGSIDVGSRLMNIKLTVDDKPCSFTGFDEVITRAVGQVEYFCRHCKGDYTQVNGYVDMIEAAVAARTLTKETCRKFAPTMQTHYYKLLIMDLQARLHKQMLDVERKKRWVAEKSALPMELRLPYEQTITAFNASINSSQMALMNIRQQIGVYQGGLFSAQQMLDYDGPLPEIDIVAVLKPIYQQATEFDRAMADMNRAIADFDVMHEAFVEEQMQAGNLAIAAKEMHEQKLADIQALCDLATVSVAQVTGQAVTGTTSAPPAESETPAAMPAQEAPDLSLESFADDPFMRLM